MNPQIKLDKDMMLPEPQSSTNISSSSQDTSSDTLGHDSKTDIKADPLVSSDYSKDIGSKLNNQKDTDLIEKEWVDKVKKIIDSNRGNPYQQSRQINQLKAEYMSHKYNKVIKLAEE